jgi:hypothetical protein
MLFGSVGILILIALSLLTSSQYIDPIPDPFPKPRTSQRTAIIVSGHLRSGNISFASGLSHVHNFGRTKFGPDGPPTPIKTVLDRLILPLALHGGVDVFIYIPVGYNVTGPPGPWDGDVLTFEENQYPGDTRACRLYSENPIFDERTGNNVFCLLEPEKKLMDRFINKFKYWKQYSQYEVPHAREMLLQQEYGKYRANYAAKEQAILIGKNYTYKVRIRPDEAMIKPLPPLTDFAFRNSSPDCKRGTIYYPNITLFGYSAIDSFNIGQANDMDKLFNRFVYLATEPLEVMWPKMKQNHHWNSERHIRHMLWAMFGICMRTHPNFLATKIRRNNHTKPLTNIPRVGEDWVVLRRNQKVIHSW